MKKLLSHFTKADRLLWLSSISLVILFFLLFDRAGYLTLAASLIGVTSLIFNAKGNPIGQILMILFSVLYGIISYSFAYYGEMVTYLGMTAPMAAVALVAWLKNPYKGNRAEVAVAHMRGKDWILMSAATIAVTVAFYIILQYFHTANLIPSTVSVTTSFAAAWLTYKRSPWFAVAYALNDIALIVLWVLASLTDRSYVSVTVCFILFLVNDLYGFLSWRKMRARQEQNISAGS
jgi:nicotinamide mononucleotide transporter PnuC